jgi:cleavage and polyadenylation specificity factor subunit 1
MSLFFLLHMIALIVLCPSGYIEPVLLVLHEKDPTWAGRAAVKKHTCMVTALSINTTLKQHPLIWSASVCLRTTISRSCFLSILLIQARNCGLFALQNLPYDAYMLLAVPSPIGGVIIVAANSIHYHSQVFDLDKTIQTHVFFQIYSTLIRL